MAVLPDVDRSSENSVKAVIPFDYGKMDKIKRFLEAAQDKAFDLVGVTYRMKREGEEKIVVFCEGDEKSIKVMEKWLKRNLKVR